MRIFIPYIRLPTGLQKPKPFTATGFAVVLSIFALSTSLEAAEDYYTWVDENGVTNYAERNPQGYQARYITKTQRFGQRIAPTPEATPGIPDAPQGAPPVDPDDVISEERAAISAEIASAKKSNCDIGKKNLARLEMFSRVRVTDEKGESRTLNADEKSAKEEEARKIIRENCTG